MSNLVFVSKEDPLSVYFRYPVNLPFHGRNLPSVHHCYGYTMLRVQGETELAEKLATDRDLARYPTKIDGWLAENGFRISADWMLVAAEVYDDILTHLVVEKSDFCRALLDTLRHTEVPSTAQFVVVSGDHEGVWSCGWKESMYQRNLTNGSQYEPPGFHIYGAALRRAADLATNRIQLSYHMNLAEQKLVVNPSKPYSVLLLSDSMGRYIKYIEHGVAVVQSGGTFGSLLDALPDILSNLGLDRGDFHNVVISAGLNDCQLPYHEQVAGVEKLKEWVDEASKVTEVLVCPTFSHPQRPRSATYSSWVARKLVNKDGKLPCRMVKWEHGNPLWSEDGFQYDLLGDKLHPSHVGFRKLWKIWAKYLPDLRLVPYVLDTYPWGNRNLTDRRLRELAMGFKENRDTGGFHVDSVPQGSVPQADDDYQFSRKRRFPDSRD